MKHPESSRGPEDEAQEVPQAGNWPPIPRAEQMAQIPEDDLEDFMAGDELALEQLQREKESRDQGIKPIIALTNEQIEGDLGRRAYSLWLLQREQARRQAEELQADSGDKPN